MCVAQTSREERAIIIAFAPTVGVCFGLFVFPQQAPPLLDSFTKERSQPAGGTRTGGTALSLFCSC